jgi:hypothetical protein
VDIDVTAPIGVILGDNNCGDGCTMHFTLENVLIYGNKLW